MAEADIWTIRRLLSWTRDYFARHGIEEPRLDAEILLGHVLQKSRIYLYTDFNQIVNPEELAAFKVLIQKRVAGYCTAVLVGKREFMGLTFHVNEHVLVPRPDTEAWLETIIGNYRNLPDISMLDLGTGSGAIAISFLSFCKEAKGVAVDISPEALAVAKENGETAGVASRIEWREGDFLKALLPSEIFDVVLTNPPYIPRAVIETLAPEVRREPHLALDGGEDGLDFYRILAKDAAPHVKSGGLLAMEVGIGQAEAVQKLFAENPAWSGSSVLRDCGGIARAVCVRRSEA